MLKLPNFWFAVFSFSASEYFNSYHKISVISLFNFVGLIYLGIADITNGWVKARVFNQLNTSAQLEYEKASPLLWGNSIYWL